MNSPFNNGCECDIQGGGWCERHDCRKTPHWVKLCRTRPDYFRAWEEGRGPGQKVILEPKPRVVMASGAGPGAQLHRILSRLGIQPSGGCACKSRARIMNQWGPEKCKENLETIVSWMAEEAGKRGLPFSPAVARIIVRMAIRKSLRAQGRSHIENTQSGLNPRE